MKPLLKPLLKQALKELWDVLWVTALAAFIGFFYSTHSVFQQADNFRESLGLIDPLFVLGGLVFIVTVLGVVGALMALGTTLIHGPIHGPERQFIANETNESELERKLRKWREEEQREKAVENRMLRWRV